MSDKPSDGGPAFPFPVCAADGNLGNGAHQGMALRDYFAARSISTAAKWYDEERNIAACAYRIADAMLAEMEKPCDSKQNS